MQYIYYMQYFSTKQLYFLYHVLCSIVTSPVTVFIYTSMSQSFMPTAVSLAMAPCGISLIKA